MKQVVKRLLENVLGLDIAKPMMAVRPDDTFIVSYPRSGNTWVRFLVANLLHPQVPVTFDNIEQLIPDAEAQSKRYLRGVPSPRTIKSHSYFDPRYPRVIYIVRDPRDVALSYYDLSRKYRLIEDSYPLERYIGDFVNGRLIPPGRGTWGENVASWVFARGARPGFLLLQYEDITARPERELTKLASFFGIAASPELLQAALDRSSATRMREMERTQGKNWISTRNKRDDIPFIGAALVGEWKRKLRPEWVAEIEAAWGRIMVQLGYELVTRKAESAEIPLAAKTVLGERRG